MPRTEELGFQAPASVPPLTAPWSHPCWGLGPKTGCVSAPGRSATPPPPLTEDAGKPTGVPRCLPAPGRGDPKAHALLCCSCLSPCWVCTVVPCGRFQGQGSSHSTSGGLWGSFIFLVAWLPYALVSNNTRGFLELAAAPRSPRHKDRPGRCNLPSARAASPMCRADVSDHRTISWQTRLGTVRASRVILDGSSRPLKT